MKDLGAARKTLNMENHRDRASGKLFLNQKTYVEKIFSRFRMKKSKPISTPTTISCKLSSSMSLQTK